MAGIVAIMGRPNVGKSTLFNRITGSRRAMVHNRPGVTRDRNYARAEYGGTEFTVVDTGGFAKDDPDAFVDQIHSQLARALEEADAVIMLFDGRVGLTPYDRDLMDLVRPLGKPVFYAVNKIDTREQEAHVAEFAAIGADPLYGISAEHGLGILELLEDLVAVLPEEKEQATDEDMVRVAVVGRPNVGKSSLINRLLGDRRLVVSDVPGTTRDSVDTLCRAGARPYLLVDTAGIRRKGRVKKTLEKFSVVRALKSLERCDVALLLLDAAEGLTDQDLHVAGYAAERGCGVVVAANKWDLVQGDPKAAVKFERGFRDRAKFLPYAPFVTVSAKTGLRVNRILPLVDQVYAQYESRLSTGPLNRVLEEAVARHEPPLYRGRPVKFYYATQAAAKPPTFVLFVNQPKGIHFSYERYLKNAIAKGAGLDKTPIRLKFRQRKRRE